MPAPTTAKRGQTRFKQDTWLAGTRGCGGGRTASGGKSSAAIAPTTRVSDTVAWSHTVEGRADARRQLELGARIATRIKHRVGALTEVTRRAAQTDPEIGVLWQLFQDQYLENQTMMAESLAAKGALRDGLDVADAAEIFWTLNHPSVYYLLVYERGWSEERYERWLADAFVHQLLR